MGIALIKLRIMPSSPDTDLEKIKEQGKKKIEEKGGEVSRYEEDPIAFGLKAVIAYIRIDEKIEGTDFLENAFTEMPEVTSADVVDYRRAVE